LGAIKKWKSARRLFLCVAVASRPLRVEELADILAFDFEEGQIPKFNKKWRQRNPVQAVLSTSSTMLSVVKVKRSYCYDRDYEVVQFAHFTVKEFLFSGRLAEKDDAISRYHISMTDAHTLVAQACLGILLHLEKDVTRDDLKNFPLAGYAAEHWPEHARIEGVSQNVAEGMQQLFDRRKHHLAVWLWMYDPTLPFWKRDNSAEVPLTPCGTPLHYAACCGIQGLVKTLANENPENVNSRSFDNESMPLHLASEEGHLEVVRTLFEHRADIEARTKDGETPLHLASQRRHMELAQFLIEHGANVEARTKDGETMLIWASCRGHVKLSRLFLEHGANTETQTKDGETLLHLASQWGHEIPTPLLLQHGADVAAETEDGETPLHSASHWGRAELARLLLEHGADVAAETKDGETPLHWASHWGHVELARLLLMHGANVAARSKDGETPLHWASYRGHVELAQLLLEHGADVGDQNEDGETPLHWTSDLGDVKLARLLLEHGADATAKTKNGSTPLQRASYWGHVELIGVLEHSADVASNSILQTQQPAPM
jgi:ankyrin repeat protein